MDKYVLGTIYLLGMSKRKKIPAHMSLHSTRGNSSRKKERKKGRKKEKKEGRKEERERERGREEGRKKEVIKLSRCESKVGRLFL